jgi:hypothetical protein
LAGNGEAGTAAAAAAAAAGGCLVQMILSKSSGSRPLLFLDFPGIVAPNPANPVYMVGCRI